MILPAFLVRVNHPDGNCTDKDTTMRPKFLARLYGERK
jgi:hypothetical protein